MLTFIVLFPQGQVEFDANGTRIQNKVGVFQYRASTGKSGITATHSSDDTT